MPCPHPVRPIRIRWDISPGGFELLPKAYRPVTHRSGRRARLIELFRKLCGTDHERLPDLVLAVVESRKDFAAFGVKNGKDRSRASPRPQGPKRRNSGQGDAARLCKASGGCDSDPKTGEGAGADTHGDPGDRLPASDSAQSLLGRDQKLARVAGASGRVGIHGELAHDFVSRRDRDAQVSGGGVDPQNVVHGLSVRPAWPMIGTMSAFQAPAAIATSLVLAIGGTGLAACGNDKAPGAQPESGQEIQEKVSDALDSSEKSKKERKQAEERAEEAQKDVTEALEDAQDQTDNSAGYPAY